MKMNKKKKFAILAAVFLLLCIWILHDNKALEVNTYPVHSSRIPQAFSGFRIAQISDLHNTRFGEHNNKLLTLLRQAEPDIIVITGDLIDSRRTNVDIALEFCRSALKIAPVYYVTGNHESRVAEYADLKTGMTAAGVVLLENEKVRFEKEGEYVTLLGIQDPSFTTDYLFGDAGSVAAANIASLQEETDGYTVLLSHRPELFETYTAAGVDLVFSGHAHGGQFRLPFIGGLFAPNQGLFPKYDAGAYTKEYTTMLVSRGLGNSIIPLRIFNRPEIVVAELGNEE